MLQVEPAFVVFISALASIAIVWLQYAQKVKQKKGIYVLLAALRFVAIWGIILLLANLTVTKKVFSLEKPELLLLADNSRSIDYSGLGSTQVKALDLLKSNNGVKERFDLRSYQFGEILSPEDSLTFDQPLTNISGSLNSLSRIHPRSKKAVILLTDGNHTIGEDYEFWSDIEGLKIYPIVIGDTTRYDDIRIDQVNTNQFAFLNNRYPIEILVAYEGDQAVESILTIREDGREVFRQDLNLSRVSGAATVNTLIEAGSTGLKKLEVSLQELPGERNTTNNSRELTVEVIDEKTDIVIVSDYLHPDLGALTKAIESNEQRTVRVVKPNAGPDTWEEADLILMYQPNFAFNEVYNFVKSSGISTFTITGPLTDWVFLNGIQDNFQKESYNQTEEVSPLINKGFAAFDIAAFSTEDFPPLQTQLGELLIIKPNESLLFQSIKGTELPDPLLSLITDRENREALLLGADIWKWRMQTFRNEGSFKTFDDFIGKIILYLSSKKPRNRLSLDYESSYGGIVKPYIRASYFDETFVFDPDATLTLEIQDTSDGTARELPMLLKKRYYEADLSGLKAGNYSFKATVEGKGISESGIFSILDFDIEKQFVSSNYQKLQRLADRSGGRLYFPDQIEDLISNLEADDSYVPVQKSEQNVVSLLDFRALLAIILGAFGIEWLIRKYIGLI